MASNPPRRVAVVVLAPARKELLALPARFQGQVQRAIDRLIAELRAGRRPQDMRKLRGLPDTHRIDSGEYRILFALEAGEVVVLETDGAEDELTVAQAAEQLGTPPIDVRRRIQRRRLTSEPGQIVTILRVRHRREAYRNL